MKTDFLIIGSGIAGLSYAIKVAKELPDASVTIVTKSATGEGNTRYAQGGIAVVTDFFHDSFEKHVEDTLAAGDYVNKRETVEMVVREAPARLQELINWGTNFDKNTRGNFHLGKEGGHSKNRILHHKDITGKSIEDTLRQQCFDLPNITILTNYLAIDLIINEEGQCAGVEVMNKYLHKIFPIYSGFTLLATGGAGQIFAHTTNPEIATGDGIAMAYRAGAAVKDMQFVQFHPTALYHSEDNPAFLISEAVRGFGAVLRRKDGSSFMEDYDQRGSLASRDIVSRAIFNEMQKAGEGFVYLDCTELNLKEFKKHFPNIYAKCKSIGFNPAKVMIPVTPAAHYFCGGIETDLQGRTSIPNLYACGECACTGLHGANRLASNSLLEGLVFSHHCFINIFSTYPAYTDLDDYSYAIEPEVITILSEIKAELRAVMSKYCGIVKTTRHLRKAYKIVKGLEFKASEIEKEHNFSPESIELKNLFVNALLVLEQSISMVENKGTFYNKDFARIPSPIS